MNSNEEISSLCDRIMAVCNRINKRLDVIDEQQCSFTYTDPYNQSQPYSDPYRQPYTDLYSQPYTNTDPSWGNSSNYGLNPYPQPRNAGQPYQQPHNPHWCPSASPQQLQLSHARPPTCWDPQAQQPYCWEPQAQPPDIIDWQRPQQPRNQDAEPFGQLQNPRPGAHPRQPDCTVFYPPSNHHTAASLPAAVPQPPQLPTTESQNCHGQPVAELQPLLHPTSLYRSTVVPMAADTAIPPSAYCVLNEEEEEELHVPKVINEAQDDAEPVVETPAKIDIKPNKSCDAFVLNLKDEEEQLFSGSKEDNRVSGASRRIAQEEEEKLILQKIPLQKMMVVIMTKCGFKVNDKFQKDGVGDGLQDPYVSYHYTFDPGGDVSPKLRFSTLFVASWFPP